MYTAKEIGEKIRQLRGDLSLRDFAKKCDISHTTIDTLEKGVDFRTGKPTQVKVTTLQKIADACLVPISYLTGERLINNLSPENKKSGHRIPVLGYVAAGIPIEAIEDVIDYEELSPETVKDGAEYFALQIQGASMEPKISDGDVVIVRKQPDVDSGQIAIVCVNGDRATCKKVMKHPGGILLQPLNPAYEATFYSADEVQNLPITILGRVIELRAKF